VRIIGINTAILAGNFISRLSINLWWSRRKEIEIVASEVREVMDKAVKDGMIRAVRAVIFPLV
jgi:hypothetical protein